MLRAMKDLTFDDLESWLNLDEKKSFTAIVVGTISVGERHKIMYLWRENSMLKLFIK